MSNTRKDNPENPENKLPGFNIIIVPRDQPPPEKYAVVAEGCSMYLGMFQSADDPNMFSNRGNVPPAMQPLFALGILDAIMKSMFRAPGPTENVEEGLLVPDKRIFVPGERN